MAPVTLWYDLSKDSWKSLATCDCPYDVEMCFVLSASEPIINTWYFVYIAHTLSLLYPPSALEKDSVCLRWAIEQETVGGCGNATEKAMIHSCQSGLCNSHYHGKQRKNISGLCLKVLSGLCFERRRMMIMVMAGYIRSQKYLTSVICWTGPVWILHKSAFLCKNVKQSFDLKTCCRHIRYLRFNNITQHWGNLMGSSSPKGHSFFNLWQHEYLGIHLDHNTLC